MIRILVFSLSFLLLTFSSTAQETTIGTVDVDLDNELQSLAKGYAAAFDAMPTGPKYVMIRQDGETMFLSGSVRDIEAIEGVVMIMVERGPVTVISANDVVRITNSKAP